MNTLSKVLNPAITDERSATIAPRCQRWARSSGQATVPERDISLLLLWVRRAKTARFTEKEIEDGIEEIFEEYRTCGEHRAVEYLRVWAQMLRVQSFELTVQQ